MRYETENYRAYARECQQMAERAKSPEVRKKLIHLAQTWLEAASNEERFAAAEKAKERGAA